jgi:hypothetical protein
VAVERRPGVAVFPVEGTGWRWWRDTTFAYVGDRSPAAQFTDAEVKGAIDRARAGLTDVKAERVGNLLRTLLNSRPILARFAQVLDAEGVALHRRGSEADEAPLCSRAPRIQRLLTLMAAPAAFRVFSSTARRRTSRTSPRIRS